MMEGGSNSQVILFKLTHESSNKTSLLSDNYHENKALHDLGKGNIVHLSKISSL